MGDGQTYSLVKLSDVVRDAMSVELVSDDLRASYPVAEIIRVDVERKFLLNTFGNELDVSLIENFILEAKELLGRFEDGTVLSEANRSGRLVRRVAAKSDQ